MDYRVLWKRQERLFRISFQWISFSVLQFLRSLMAPSNNKLPNLAVVAGLNLIVRLSVERACSSPVASPQSRAPSEIRTVVARNVVGDLSGDAVASVHQNNDC